MTRYVGCVIILSLEKSSMSKIYIIETSKSESDGTGVVAVIFIALVLLAIILGNYKSSDSTTANATAQQTDQSVTKADLDKAIQKQRVDNPEHRIYSSND